jgi:serine racemase
MSKTRQSPSPSPHHEHCITYNDVLTASKRIKSTIHKTPVLTSSSINALCDNRNLFFKVEAMQKTGSFKFRGACNATLALVESQRDCATTSGCDVIHVVTHSSGNHAAAVALAANQASKGQQQNMKIKSTIVMPRNAPIIKVNGVKGFGGNIISVDNTNEAREEMADIIVKRDKATFIHPSENEYVIAGQGTVSLEMVDQVKDIIRNQTQTNMELEVEGGERRNNVDDASYCDLDAVIIPVGGGGLAAGNTIALRGLLGDKVKVRAC